MKKPTDFSECKLIKENLRFYTYLDFVKNCKVIKKRFWELTDNGRIFYMYYIYANTHMELNYKNAIWDYLNFDNEFCYTELFRLKRFYKVK